MKMLSYPTPVYVLAGSVRCEDLTKMAERRRIAAQLVQANPRRSGVRSAGRHIAGRGLIAIGTWIRGPAPVPTAAGQNVTG